MTKSFRKDVQQIKELLSPYMDHFSLTLASLLLSQILFILEPKIFGIMVDRVREGRWEKMPLLFVSAILVVLGAYGLQIFWAKRLFFGYYRILQGIRERVFSKVLREEPAFLVKNSPSALLSRLESDVEKLAELAGYGVLAGTDGIFMPILVLGMMASIDWRIPPALMFFFPLVIFVNRTLGKAYERYYERTQKEREKLMNFTLSTMTFLKVIRIEGAEPFFYGHFQRRVRDALGYELKKSMMGAFFFHSSKIFFVICGLITIFLGARGVSAGRLTLGQLTSLTFYYSYLLWPAMGLSDFLVLLADGRGALHHIENTLTPPPKERGLVFPRFESVELSRVSYHYPGKKRKVIENMDLFFRRGEKLGIVGPVGSGKSTLVRLLTGYERLLEDGRKFNARAEGDVNLRAFRSFFRVVPQEHYLFSASLRENISFFEDFPDEMILAALESADFLKDLESLSRGLDTLCGERGLVLSGGQKQRISLARALVNPGDVLVLDDILSAVDAKTEEVILENLKKNSSIESMIVVSHRVSALKEMDRILVLRGGRVIDQGTFEELSEREGWFKEQVLLQRGEGEYGDKDQSSPGTL